MSVSKERRESLREGVETAESHGFTVPVHPDELRALLDLADERDRYRALLVDIYHDKWTDPDLMERIERALGTEHPRHDAALEGK